MALVKSIIFVDGENLAIRYQSLLAEGRTAKPGNSHIQDVFVWRRDFGQHWFIDTDVFRVNYYSSMVGDDDALAATRAQIAKEGFYHSGDCYGPCQIYPRLYKKSKKSAKSRLVDINITIDVMRHAYTDAIDVVYLLSGDGDFVSLVKEVARSGKKICVGAFSSGLEPKLTTGVDRFILLDELFLEGQPSG